MKKLNYKFITLLFITIFTCFLAISPVFAQAPPATSPSVITPETIKCIEGTEDQPSNICCFLDMFINISNVVLYLIGIFAIVMFIYGGVIMITAYGAEARIKWGKDILVATVIGIFIVLFAWFFVNVLIQINLGDSSIPGWETAGGICEGII